MVLHESFYMLTYKLNHNARMGEVIETRLGKNGIDLFDFNYVILEKRGTMKSTMTCTRQITIGEGGVSRME